MKKLFYQNYDKEEISNNDRLVEKINQLKKDGCTLLNTIKNDRILVRNTKEKRKETNPVLYDMNERFCAIVSSSYSSSAAADNGISSVCMNSSLNKEMTNIVEKQIFEEKEKEFVNYINKNKDVDPPVPPPTPVDDNPLCFTALVNNAKIGLFKAVEDYDCGTYQYSFNKIDWYDWTLVGYCDIESVLLTLENIGDKIYFRGKRTKNQSVETEKYVVFYQGSESSSSSIPLMKVSGNCNSLLDKDNYKTMTDLGEFGEYAFMSLFVGFKCEDFSELLLPATTLSYLCYHSMFSESLIKTAPELKATTLSEFCYALMFTDCSNLNYVKCLCDPSSSSATIAALTMWLDGVGETGTFVCKSESLGFWSNPESGGVPSTWTIVDEEGNSIDDTPTDGDDSGDDTPTDGDDSGDDTPTDGDDSGDDTPTEGGGDDGGDTPTEGGGDDTPTDGDEIDYSNEPLCFEALVDDAKFAICSYDVNNYNCGEYFISSDKETWLKWPVDDIANINNYFTFSKGDKIYIGGIRNKENPQDENNFVLFYQGDETNESTDYFKVSGNINSLLDYNNFRNITDLTEYGDYCFYSLFAYFKSKDFSNLVLPATTLTRGCYEYMFYYSLIMKAPELKATTLTESCYAMMFANCSNLNYVKCLCRTDSSATNEALMDWLEGVGETGTFVCKSDYLGFWSNPYSGGGVPSTWYIIDEEGKSIDDMPTYDDDTL